MTLQGRTTIRPFRKGTSQRERLPELLKPENVPIDNRKLNDFLNYLVKFTRLLQYYDLQDQAILDDIWQSFFLKRGMSIDWDSHYTEEDGDVNWEYYFQDRNSPHFALFLSFLEMLSSVTTDLNSITGKHLQFYYEKVLQLSRRKAVSDTVHVVFELADSHSSYRIKEKDEATLLVAGKDANGKELLYEVEKELVVNKAQIEEVRTIYLDKEGSYHIYASPIADSGDGLGKKLAGDLPKWSSMGENQMDLASENRTMPNAQVGFAIASPILLLKEGNRRIKVEFEFHELIPFAFLEDAFHIQFSTEDQWTDPLLVHAYRSVQNPRAFVLTNSPSTDRPEIKLDAGAPRIDSFSNEDLKKEFNSSWPVLKAVINSTYGQLRELHLKKIHVEVIVEGINDLVVQSDNAVLDSTKNFQPFGTTPAVESSFYIGSTEIFSKQLDNLRLHIKWHDAPQNLRDYYKAYTGTSATEVEGRNDDFKAEVALLNGGRWDVNTMGKVTLFEDIASDEKLLHFSVNERSATSPFLDNTPEKGYVMDANLALDRNPLVQKTDQYSGGVIHGFLRLKLSDPVIAFGHKNYPQLNTSQAVKIATGGPYDDTNPPPELPNPPYTPTISSLALDYTSKLEIDVASSNEVDQFFHIHPFGNAELGETSERSLLPQFDDEGTLLVGVKDLEAGQLISFLFQFAEGSAESQQDETKINWSYLSNNQWVLFQSNEIVLDTTSEFITSGIVRLILPISATNDNTILPSGLHWIKVAAKSHSAGIPKLIKIYTQATIARYQPRDENDLNHLKSPLKEGSIRRMKQKVVEIKSVYQPSASFGGKVAEQDHDYYVRVSERLRHKKRAVSIWDYERLILENFPSIYKTRILPHTNQSSENAPGSVTAVVIPDPRNQNAIDPFEPKANVKTLLSIRDYLASLSGSFVHLTVQNPIYEQLLVDCKVGYHTEYDPNFYSSELNTAIQKYLSPWAFNEDHDIDFGGEIYQSELLAFVESQEYVDFVNDFRLFRVRSASLPTRENLVVDPDPPSDHKRLSFSVADETGANRLHLDFEVQFGDPSQPKADNLGETLRGAFRNSIDLDDFGDDFIQSVIERVDDVLDVRALNITRVFREDEVMKQVRIASPSNSRAILVTTRNHIIRPLSSGEYVCLGAENLGIGFMVVDVDFIVR